MTAHETITAIATPSGEGAIALIRISGSQAITIAETLFQGRISCQEMTPRFLYLGKIVEQEKVLDEVLLAIFKAPQSYTGEDMVEISCHGGSLISARILQAFLHAGARLARPGEFTQRAYLHGKMDLTQAEAVMDLIHAQTGRAQQVASEQLSGRLGEEIVELKAALLGAVAHLEAYIDFPEEDISPETGRELQRRLEQSRKKMLFLLSTATEGRLLREGFSLALCGAPNAGKSSLLNRLLGQNRAIVTPIAGTTRDRIEEVASLNGFPVQLIDTAGLRETEEMIEREGIARSYQAIASANLTVHLVDAAQLQATLEPLHAKELLVFNKIDLLSESESLQKKFPAAIFLSCKTGEGLEELKKAIVSRIVGKKDMLQEDAASSFAINARHQACLQRAVQSLDTVLVLFQEGQPPEILAVELHAALQALGDVVGGSSTEDILGEIFGNFCIGK